MKRKFFLFLCLLMVLSLIPQVAFADEIPKEIPEDASRLGTEIRIEGVLSAPSKNGLVVTPNQKGIVSPTCVACVGYSTKTTTLSGPVKLRKFVRYLSSSWGNVSSYTWSTTQTASATVSASISAEAKVISANLNVSNTVTSTFSTSVNIPANSSYKSKLAYYVDYNLRNIKFVASLNGVPVLTEYGEHYAPSSDSYLVVVYQ